MDSDIRRPQRNDKEPLDTHIPHPENYQTPGPGDVNRVQGEDVVDQKPIQDIMPPVQSQQNEKSDSIKDSIEEFDSPAPVAAPTKPVRPQAPKRRLPRVLPLSNKSSSDAQDPTASPEAANGPTKKVKGRGVWKWILGALAIIILLAAIAGFVCYTDYASNLEAVEPNSTESARVVIPEGSTRTDIANILDEAGLIRSVDAFNLYYRLNAGEGMKAGTYMIEKNMDVPAIVDKLESGKVDEFMLTFLPGGTIFDAIEVMVKAGYSEQEVEDALYAEYDSPIMKDRPAGSSIEGYLYGETYSFFSGSSAHDVFARVIKELENYMVANDTEAKFTARGFNIHQGLTFASLVQTEVRSVEEMKQVSSVFHNRLGIDMMLGSDVTFRYAAKLLDEPVAIDIDSPYNTRVYKGLPPGPVAAPGASAIEATVEPAETDYLFFVSGDDGITYFSRTNEEHERLTAQHCHANCAVQM